MSIETSCFSKENFDRVYEYIKVQTGKNPEQECYVYQSYEWHVTAPDLISMKKDNFTHVIINREKGIYSLAKIWNDNKNLVSKASALFCQLVDEAGKV